MEDTKNNPSTQPLPTVPSVGTGSKESGTTAQIEQISERPVINPDVSKFVEHSEPLVPSHQNLTPSAESAMLNTTKPIATVKMSDEEMEKALKKGVSLNLDIHSHMENVYSEDSADFLAVLYKKIEKIKQLIKSGLILSPKPA